MQRALEENDYMYYIKMKRIIEVNDKEEILFEDIFAKDEDDATALDKFDNLISLATKMSRAFGTRDFNDNIYLTIESENIEIDKVLIGD